MKVRYEFVNGEISEIEVDDNLGELLVDFDRQEYNNDHKETRRHTSLDGMEYEGEAFLSPENTEEQVLKREDMARLLRAMEALTANPLNKPGGVVSSRRKHREKLSGQGAGKAYRKFYGRHEHRVAAEAMLGRPLRPGEVVHHRDGDKLNNDPMNLEVLPSQAEHTKTQCRDPQGRWCK